MFIIGLDVETTGHAEEAEDQEKTPAESEIVEFGAILYDTSRKMVVASYGMIYQTDNRSLENAENVHKIPYELTELMYKPEDTIDPADVIRLDLADYIVAHNAAHDHPLVVSHWPSFLQKPWLCTQYDLNHEEVLPRSVYSRRLGHLCVDYGITLSGWHRAVADAEACARMAAEHDLDKAYELKCATKYRLICSGPFVKNVGDLLKQAPSVLKDNKRYRWSMDGYPKCWVKEKLLKEDLILDTEYIKDITRNRWDFNLEKMDPPIY